MWAVGWQVHQLQTLLVLKDKGLNRLGRVRRGIIQDYEPEAILVEVD